jgi:hypothetical protein
MNRLESLPDDIVDYIFKIAHASKFEQTLRSIELHNRRNPDFDTHIWSLFFSSNMTNTDIREWYVFTRWVDIVIDNRCHPRWLEGLTPEFIKEMDECKYVGIYKDLLRRRRM